MLALAITDVFVAGPGRGGPHAEANADWIELTNIGTTPIVFEHLFLSIKTGGNLTGRSLKLNIMRPEDRRYLTLEPGNSVRLVGGEGKLAGREAAAGTRCIRLKVNDRLLHPSADVIAIYQCAEDRTNNRLPLTQITFV